MASLHLSTISRWLLQSPPATWVLSILRDLLIGAIRQGPVPQHIGIVMDGNRRFARKNHIETVEGHNLGFEALAKIIEVCYKAGVKVVTVYAFSIENFKRSKFEVDALMDMARVKLSQLAQHGELLDRYGACIRVLGQRDLVKPEVLEAVDEAVAITAHNTSAVLNICFPYTSRDEITSAVRSTVAAYSRPARPHHFKRPFSENHIAHNIRYRKLSTLREESSSRSPSPERAAVEAPRATTAPAARDADADEQHSISNAASTPSDEQDPLADPPPPNSPSTSAHSSSTTLTHSSSNHTSPPPSATHSPPTSTVNGIPRTAVAAGGDGDGASSAHDSRAHQPGSRTFPDPEHITAATLTAHMFTARSPPLDLLIRTSGVERLSDFMLWQCHEHTSIVFLSCLWPEFDLWRFLPVLVEWQWWRLKGMREERAASGESFGSAAGGGGGVGSDASGSGSAAVDEGSEMHSGRKVKAA